MVCRRRLKRVLLCFRGFCRQTANCRPRAQHRGAAREHRLARPTSSGDVHVQRCDGSDVQRVARHQEEQVWQAPAANARHRSQQDLQPKSGRAGHQVSEHNQDCALDVSIAGCSRTYGVPLSRLICLALLRPGRASDVERRLGPLQHGSIRVPDLFQGQHRGDRDGLHGGLALRMRCEPCLSLGSFIPNLSCCLTASFFVRDFCQPRSSPSSSTFCLGESSRSALVVATSTCFRWERRSSCCMLWFTC
jgi:hypothetical protein